MLFKQFFVVVVGLFILFNVIIASANSPNNGRNAKREKIVFISVRVVCNRCYFMHTENFVEKHIEKIERRRGQKIERKREPKGGMRQKTKL